MFCVGSAKEGLEEVEKVSHLRPVVGIGLIRACVGNEDGTSNLVLQGLARGRFTEWTQEGPFKIGRLELVKSIPGNPIEADALAEKVKEFCVRIAEIGLPLPPNLMEHLNQIDSPEVLSDVAAAAFVTDPAQRQQLLEARDVCERLRLLIQFFRGIAHDE
jgi:ATP-dependent Lon protease